MTVVVLTTSLGSFPVVFLLFPLDIFHSVFVQCCLFCLKCCRAPLSLLSETIWCSFPRPSSTQLVYFLVWLSFRYFAELGSIHVVAFSARAYLELRSISLLPLSFLCPLFTQFLFGLVLLCSDCSRASFTGLRVTFFLNTFLLGPLAPSSFLKGLSSE